MLVTPAITLNDTEDITAEKLNLLGTPGVEMEAADVAQVLASVQAALGAGVTGRNYFENPGLDRWTRGAGPVSLAQGVREELADAWWARCNSATSMGSGGTLLPTYERISSTHHQQWIYGAKLTGETGVGSCDFGQDLAAPVSAGLYQTLTVTFDLYNATGAAFVPEVRLDTCDAFEIYSAVTHQLSGAGQSCPNNELTTVTVTLSTSAVGAALRNGAQLCLRIPSGRLAANTQYVEIYALKVEASATATTRYPERDRTPITEQSGTGSEGTPVNWLRNGDFSANKGVPVTAVEDTDVFMFDHWAVNPADGSDLLYEASSTVPVNARVKYSAKLTGGEATTGTVDFVQNIPAEVAAGMVEQLAVFSVYVFNGSGAAFQPSLRLHTCNAYNSFASTTAVETSSGTTCPDNAWTRLSLAFNGATAANLANGARLIIRFPAGSLDSNAKVVRITQAQLEIGTTPSDYAPRVESLPIATAAQNLAVWTSAAAELTITADELILLEPGGAGMRLRNQGLTLSITGGTGAGGLDTGTISGSGAMYDLYVISNGNTTHTLCCVANAEPAMPAGYRYRARIGCFHAAGAAIKPMLQRGNVAMIEAVALFAGTVTTADTYQQINTNVHVPPWAASVGLQVQIEEEANLKAAIKCVAGAFSIGEQILVQPSVGAAASYGGVYSSARVTLPVIGTPDVRFKASDNTRDYRVLLLGWTLP